MRPRFRVGDGPRTGWPPDTSSLQADAPDLRARRQRIAREHDWNTLTSRIAGIMAQRLGGDVEARFHRLAQAGPVPEVGSPAVETPDYLMDGTRRG
jgi:hypothetical protein